MIITFLLGYAAGTVVTAFGLLAAVAVIYKEENKGVEE